MSLSPNIRNILIVEDELIVAGNLRSILERSGYAIIGVVRSVNQALRLLATQSPDLVMLDIFLQGDQTGIDLAIELNERDIPFVYISANSSREVLEAAKATGPYGFIVKPFRENDVLISLEIAFYRQQYRLQNRPVTTRWPATGITDSVEVPSFPGIAGSSSAMRTVFEMVQRVAHTDTSVLIQGESGTGKEMIASYIHRLSTRRSGPFVTVNCAALPAQLVESELFGHEKGAFTNAFEKKTGKFEQASGGTIFLDEIGEMPVDSQVKLLRVLQEKEIERIGGHGTFKVNVRVIAATNRVLEDEIAEGRFRLDLYYRLQVFPILLPPLRQRREDIPGLVNYFLRHYSATTGKAVSSVSPGVMEKLVGYSWPGNIRELQNLIERNVLLTTDDTIHDLELPTLDAWSNKKSSGAGKELKTMEEMEREHILEVLRHCNYRVSGPEGAARILGIPPSTLSHKMKKLGIIRIHDGND